MFDESYTAGSGIAVLPSVHFCCPHQVLFDDFLNSPHRFEDIQEVCICATWVSYTLKRIYQAAKHLTLSLTSSSRISFTKRCRTLLLVLPFNVAFPTMAKKGAGRSTKNIQDHHFQMLAL